MLKKHHKLSLIAAALIAAGAASASDYVTADGAPLHTAFGGSVRTGTAALEQPRAYVTTIRVLFGFDQAELNQDGRHALDTLVENLRGGAVNRVVAVAYTDALGPDRYNERLSELRAKAVRDYLLEKGLPFQAFQLEAKGKRDRDALAACGRDIDGKDSAKLIACLAPDRRVDIEVRVGI